ncbi:shikimate dehydrogenase [Prochlorococcus marinus]|uniref:Shikimate dehydrogenase (NADP(+)) n=1 Tax=Prochlorococcus marinus XMU1408 TaxID=2213228 RepID=A0A318R148_PROMR|nr:shikimate dehydrogenase [Prochlorococcus marinus]MBW3042965.1 shikimate dehydrogenase [Prochlorococcus marinus str. XMU1408]PYE00317.1 shikimate dehydrogenase [Prochlorococcus marinus XMU1408]
MITITGKTNLVGLLGQPVNHSLSPVMHNAAYEEMGLDWCYLAFACDKTNLIQLTTALRLIDCKGLNVTIPHKQEILKACNKFTNTAHEIQAVNTLIPEKNNEWIGANTDIDGFKVPLKNHNLINKNVIVIGCGGSARAVIMGLNSLNVKKITVIGRNEKSLKSFIHNMKNLKTNSEISIVGINYKKLNVSPYIEEADLIVNTTPIGMNSNQTEQESIPLGNEIWNSLSSHTILYDLIYTPRPTKWLKLGQEKNCFTIDGLDMLVEQGALSIKLWSGFTNVPTQIMKSSAKKHLML